MITGPGLLPAIIERGLPQGCQVKVSDHSRGRIDYCQVASVYEPKVRTQKNIKHILPPTIGTIGAALASLPFIELFASLFPMEAVGYSLRIHPAIERADGLHYTSDAGELLQRLIRVLVALNPPRIQEEQTFQMVKQRARKTSLCSDSRLSHRERRRSSMKNYRFAWGRHVGSPRPGTRPDVVVGRGATGVAVVNLIERSLAVQETLVAGVGPWNMKIVG